MRPSDSCKVCGGMGKAAFGNPQTKVVSYWANCPNCNGIGWSPEAIVRDGLDSKAIKEGIDFIIAKQEYKTGATDDHKNLGNFQKYLDHIKANGGWSMDLIKTWSPISPRSDYET